MQKDKTLINLAHIRKINDSYEISCERAAPQRIELSPYANHSSLLWIDWRVQRGYSQANRSGCEEGRRLHFPLFTPQYPQTLRTTMSSTSNAIGMRRDRLKKCRASHF